MRIPNNPSDATAITRSLRAHQAETGLPLPAPIYDIVYREQQGVVVDLISGGHFVPSDDWRDFTACWAAERSRRGRPITVNDLTAALQRTGDCLTPGPTAEYHLRRVVSSQCAEDQ